MIIIIIIMMMIVIVIIIIMSVFLERFPCETCSIALNKCKYKKQQQQQKTINSKHVRLRHLAQHLSKQSCSKSN